MYVFPVDSTVELPADWAKFAEQPTEPFAVDPAQIAENRDLWLRSGATPPRDDRPDMRRILTLIGLAAVPLAVLGVFFVLPVSGMLSAGFWVDGHFDPAAVAEVLTRPRTLRVIWFTVWSALAGTAVSVLLGVPVAHVLHRRRFLGAGRFGRCCWSRSCCRPSWSGSPSAS